MMLHNCIFSAMNIFLALVTVCGAQWPRTHCGENCRPEGDKATTHFHTMAFSLALYLAFPFIQITCTPLVLSGVGMRTCRVKNIANIESSLPVSAGQQMFAVVSRISDVGCFAHLDLLRQQRWFEVGLDDHLHLEFSAADLPHEGNDSEGQDDVFSGAIPAWQIDSLQNLWRRRVSHRSEVH